MSLNKEILGDMYYRMHQARFFEQKVQWMFSRGMIHGTTHLAMGQEASGVASCMALEKGDLLSSTHRGHAHAIGFGLDVKRMMAEIMGKATGYCKGKGGSMHIADLNSGSIGANGCVSGGFPISCGAALTQKYKKTDKIVLCFGGDGSTNEGNFHEALNLASIWKLPVLFIIENNFYGLSTPIEKHMNISDISKRAESYGIPGMTIDGNNAIEVYNSTCKAADYVRSGEGPFLLVTETYRYNGHSKSDPQVYRTREEINEWREYDPIDNLKYYLLENNMIEGKLLDQLQEQARQSIEDAVEFAVNSSEPDVMSVLDDVYA